MPKFRITLPQIAAQFDTMPFDRYEVYTVGIILENTTAFACLPTRAKIFPFNPTGLGV